MDAEKELDEYTESHMPPARRRFGLILTWTFRVLVFAIIALMVWRVFISGRVPANAKILLVNDATHAAYLAGDNDLVMYTQFNEEIVVRDTGEGDVGLFWVNQVVFIPDADQVQVLTRTPLSTFAHIQKDFDLEERPSREEHVIDVTLRVTTDPTPTDTENGDEFTTQYPASSDPVRTLTSMYTYEKYIFDGVVIDESTVQVEAVFTYARPIAVSTVPSPYATIIIYRDFLENEPLELTSRDHRALEQYGK